MHRTQLSLEEWQYASLKQAAERAGRSISDLVREILDKHLRGEQRGAPERLEAIEGVVADPSACGRDHDAVLYGRTGPAR